MQLRAGIRRTVLRLGAVLALSATALAVAPGASPPAVASSVPRIYTSGASQDTCAFFSLSYACWGANALGQLGNGTTADSPLPVTPQGLTTFPTDFAPGFRHTCALLQSQAVQCWGDDTDGELGDGTPTSAPSLTAEPPIPGLNALQVSSGGDAAAGGDFTCAITTAHTVECWGLNNAGQLGDGNFLSQASPTPVAGRLTGVVQIATGGAHACALLSTNTVRCWGDNTFGQLGKHVGTHSTKPVAVPLPSPGTAYAIVAGETHTCALLSSAAVACWGNNADGEVGDGTTTNRYAPTLVKALPAYVSQVTAGTGDTCAIETFGPTYCWGRDDQGQLGTGVVKPTPVTVPATVFGTQLTPHGPGVVYTQIAAGNGHTCAVGPEGSVFCWGGDLHGELGDGTFLLSPTPVRVLGLNPFSVQAVSEGYATGCALEGDLTARCWGEDTGSGDLLTHYSAVPVSGLTQIAQVEVGGTHGCAVTAPSGDLQCWGWNQYGQLGDTTMTDAPTPVQVNGLTAGALQVAGGQVFTCAIVAGLGPECWGDDSHGELGDGTTNQSSTPVDVNGLTGITLQLSASRSWEFACSLQLSVTTTAWCWGAGGFGQLGNGTSPVQSTSPVQVRNLSSAVQVSAGGDHACAVGKTGFASCWGGDAYGQLGNGGTKDSNIPVFVSGLDGAVLQIAAGDSHTCALLTTGEVECWGYNVDGQLGDGTTSNSSTPVVPLSGGAAAISAAGNDTCALMLSGAVDCWGSNHVGQLGDGNSSQPYSDVPVAVAGL